MRQLPLSLGLWAVALVASAQTPAGSGGGIPQIPFGQTYKDFEFPIYQNGQLSYTLKAVSAKGITINRAQATDLKIEIYTQGKVTTTITSPNADLYVNERTMRTKNTVKVDREDLTATAPICDFDLTTKKYLLRGNPGGGGARVNVILKHFDAGAGQKKPAPTASPQPSFPTAEMAVPAPAPEDNTTPVVDPRAPHNENPLDIPGASSNTNNGPLSPATPANP
jgi:hypothetical protein